MATPAKKKRIGPPKGALNNLQNGARINKARLTVGNLPREMISVRKEARAYRVALEEAVIETKGEVSLHDAHLIDALTGETMACAIGRWILRNRLDKMSTSDIVRTNDMIRKSKADRAKLFPQLKLDRDKTADTITALYSPHSEGNGDGP